MSKRILWTGIVASVLLCFLFSSNATAARMELTLGWHNLGDDFFLLSNFDEGDVFTKGKLKGATLESPKTLIWTDLDGKIESDFSGDDALYVANTGNKFDKYIAKITKKALKNAAKNEQKSNTGKKKGWKLDVLAKYNADPWEEYKANLWVMGAFDSLFDKKMIKANIGGGKYKLKLVAFANPIEGTPPTQVPEPGTMLLFGIGLLGTALVGRKIKKS